MIKLYGGVRTRASIVRWYLEELAIPYEFIKLDLAAGEQLQPALLELNPFGKVPVLVDGDFALFESGAILLYLDRQYGDPDASIEHQALLAQWTLFANATLGPGIFGEHRDRELPRLMAPLERRFSQQPYLLGDRFSVADVAVGAILNYIPILLQLDLSAYPAVVSYMQKLTEREAFGRAMVFKG
jgi:glutathione S-transferase